MFYMRIIYSPLLESNRGAKFRDQRSEVIFVCYYKQIDIILWKRRCELGLVLVGVVAGKYRWVYNSGLFHVIEDTVYAKS